MGGASGLGTLTLQLDVYADTAPDAEDATEAIREALDGYNAPMGAIDRVTATHETTTEDIDDPSAARETAIHRETSFFTITYGETVPAHATRRS